MNASFPIRTGDISYVIDLRAPSSTGEWSVQLGFSGMLEDSWGISGCSGKIYDNTGYNVGSYLEKEHYSISGSIFEERHTIHQNGILLSNQSKHVKNDYDMVKVEANYLENYTPEVFIGGRSILDENNQETHEFFRDQNDRVFFVTENAQADLGFINQIKSMGIKVATGNLSGVDGGDNLDSVYNLIIFGSATSSGNYNSGYWNGLNTNMMSLNSHLVTNENLGWYSNFGTSNPSVLKDIDQSSEKFPPELRVSGGSLIGTATTPHYLWVEFIDEGWTRMVHDSSQSDTTRAVYLPWADEFTDADTPLSSQAESKALIFDFSSDIVSMQWGNSNKIDQENYASSPSTYSGYFWQSYATGGLIYDIEIDNVWGGLGGQVGYISNNLGGNRNGLDYYVDYNGNFSDQYYSNYTEPKVEGRLYPQVRSYPTGIIYRGLDSTDGDINLYTGVVNTSHGVGGEGLLYSENSGQSLCVWHKGFFTGSRAANTDHGYCSHNLLCFSVTPTGLDWQTGYDMWSTLTPTGQRVFVNSVVGFFT